MYKRQVKLFASRDNLSERLSHSYIDLESIGQRPTAVFIVIQDEKKTYHSCLLYTSLFNQFLYKIRKENNRNNANMIILGTSGSVSYTHLPKGLM